MDKWRRTALHEAGHVVVGHHLGKHLQSVRIDSECSGSARFNDGSLANVVEEIAVCFAGRAALEEFECLHEGAGLDEDRERVWRLLDEYAPEFRDHLNRDGLNLASLIVREHKGEVQAVADALFSKRSLSREQVLRLIEPVGPIQGTDHVG
jgi:hypothetical protein